MPHKKLLLKNKIAMKKPMVMFIKETKCSEGIFKAMVEKILKGSELIAIDAIGPVGCIGIIWNPIDICLSNFLATRFTISAYFHILGTSLRGILTDVYGSLLSAPKQAYLHSLKLLNHWVGKNH